MILPDAITIAFIGAIGGLIGSLVGGVISFRVALSRLRSEEQRWRLEGRPAARFAALEQLHLMVVKEIQEFLFLHEATIDTAIPAAIWNEASDDVNKASATSEDAAHRAVGYLAPEQKQLQRNYNKAMANWLDEIAAVRRAQISHSATNTDALIAAKRQAQEIGATLVGTLERLINPPEIQQASTKKR